MFSLQQNLRIRGQNRFCPEVGGGWEVGQIMYTHVTKCKNNKILKKSLKNTVVAWNWWLIPAILATQEAEIRRIMV
jgi:hypothetical protein